MMIWDWVNFAYLHSLPLLVKKELQGYEAVYNVLKLLLGLLHGCLFPESAAAAQGSIAPLCDWEALTRWQDCMLTSHQIKFGGKCQ